MNELQLGLIALGACAVGGVVAYNKWQENRQRKEIEQALPREHTDVLLDGDRETPAMRHMPAASAEDFSLPADVGVSDVADGNRHARLEPVLNVPDALVDDGPTDYGTEADAGDAVADDTPSTQEIAVPAPPAEAAVSAAPRAGATDVPEAIVSPAIDYVAAFELVEPVSGDQILRSQRELLARVDKPVGWAGCNDRNGRWEHVSEEGQYRRLRIGLQLADRRGPLGEADLISFHGAMHNLADELMAVADMPPRDSALSAAIALDRFCASVDIQIGINVVSRGPAFAGTKIRALAEAAGMVLDASGRFVRCDDDGRVLYTLSSLEAQPFTAESMKAMSTHGMVFLLDVPCVDHGDRVFAQMLDLARRMADALNGMLVDDNRRPLTEAMLDPFRRQIGQYQSQLAAKGLPAGSALAQRLFA